MTRQSDQDYFAEREASERVAAKAARSPAAKDLHREMAQRYAAKVLVAEDADCVIPKTAVK
jgi:hypothetical protein